MFISAAKLFWTIADPLNLTLILLIIGTSLMWTRWRRLGLWLTSMITVWLLALAVLPLGSWILAPLSERYARHVIAHVTADGPVTGIVLLSGGAVDLRISAKMGHAVPGQAADRLAEFMRLARAYPNARLLICGGNARRGKHPSQREGPAIADYLVARGLSRDRLMVDDRSRDTYENAKFGAELAQPEPGQRWLLVTSAWHMPRAMAVFQAQGWPVIAAPAGVRDTPFRLRFKLNDGLKQIRIAWHEYLGLVAYRLNGRIETLWPAI